MNSACNCLYREREREREREKIGEWREKGGIY
jgi:hypothetical protein